MTKMKTLMKALETTKVDSSSLTYMKNVLKKSGDLPNGQPGKYGDSDVTPKDAATMLCAIIGASGRKQVTGADSAVSLVSPCVVEQYHRDREKYCKEPDNFFGLPSQGHTFHQALTAIIERAMRDDLQGVNYLSASVRRRGLKAEIEIDTVAESYAAQYFLPTEIDPSFISGSNAVEKVKSAISYIQELHEIYGGKPGTYEVTRSVSLPVFQELGRIFRE